MKNRSDAFSHSHNSSKSDYETNYGYRKLHDFPDRYVVLGLHGGKKDNMITC